MANELLAVYQLKIQLKNIRPPIWRRFLVSKSSSLKDLHHVIQIVMGWTNSHLHQFICGNLRYGKVDPEFDMGWGDRVQDELDFKIKDILKNEQWI